MISRDEMLCELSEIELILADDQLKDEDRTALYGAQQALRNVLAPETWQTASQTFYRPDARPQEASSTSQH